MPRAVIERIVRTAQRTASWCNSQPWHATIISGAETERFRKAMYESAASGAEAAPDFPWPREYLGVYLARRRESGFQLYDAVGIAKGDRAAAAKQALENFNFFGAPHVAIITTTEPLGVYGAVDCGAYVGNFMLAAQALGIGSIAQAALARRSDVVREYLKLARRPARRLRHLVRLPKTRPRHQQLPHLPRAAVRSRDVPGGVVTHSASSPRRRGSSIPERQRPNRKCCGVLDARLRGHDGCCEARTHCLFLDHHFPQETSALTADFTSPSCALASSRTRCILVRGPP